MSRDETAPERPARKSGKWVAIGLVISLVVGVILAVTLWFMGREPFGPILAMRAIDAERVALLRRGFEERGYTHVGVWKADGSMLWSEALFGVQEGSGLTVTDDLVLVLATEARGNPALHAFDRRTGEFRWKVEQSERERFWVDQGVGVLTPEREGPSRFVDLETGEPISGPRLAPPGEPGAQGEVGLSRRSRRAEPPPEPETGLRYLEEHQLLCSATERCRRVGLEDERFGYDAVDDAVWIHTDTELAVLRGPDLEPVGERPPFVSESVGDLAFWEVGER